MTWMTPLDAITSALITLALLTVTPALVPIVSEPPCTVRTEKRQEIRTESVSEPARIPVGIRTDTRQLSRTRPAVPAGRSPGP
jgi:hypothetical protein